MSTIFQQTLYVPHNLSHLSVGHRALGFLITLPRHCCGAHKSIFAPCDVMPVLHASTSKNVKSAHRRVAWAICSYSDGESSHLYLLATQSWPNVWIVQTATLAESVIFHRFNLFIRKKVPSHHSFTLNPVHYFYVPPTFLVTCSFSLLHVTRSLRSDKFAVRITH